MVTLLSKVVTKDSKVCPQKCGNKNKPELRNGTKAKISLPMSEVVFNNQIVIKCIVIIIVQ